MTMTKASVLTLLKKWATWKSIFALLGLEILFNGFILPRTVSSATLDLPALDLQFWYTPQRAYEIIGAWPPELRTSVALMHLTIDILYPLVYGLLLSLLLIIAFRRAYPRHPLADLVIFLPWGGVLFDYLENFGLAAMYLRYPQELLSVAWMTTVFTAAKWILVGVSCLLILAGAVKLALTARRS